MRPAPFVRVALLVATSLVAASAQTRDATSVLRDLRTALGGAAALDAVRTLSANGSVTERMGRFTKSYSLELFVMLPDHYMTVRHDSQPFGLRPIDITYFKGFAGSRLIRRTDSTIPFPPDPGPQTPDAVAKREADQLLRNQQEFARLVAALFGAPVDSYRLSFSLVGVEPLEGRPVEVLEGRSADGFVVRLCVDARTHLPALMAWQAPRPALITTSSSSTVAVRGGQVVSQSPMPPPSPVPAGDPWAGAPVVTWRLVVSDFKAEDGLNWPHRFRIMVGDETTEDMRLGRFKLNPRIDAKRFDVGR